MEAPSPAPEAVAAARTAADLLAAAAGLEPATAAPGVLARAAADYRAAIAAVAAALPAAPPAGEPTAAAAEPPELAPAPPPAAAGAAGTAPPPPAAAGGASAPDNESAVPPHSVPIHANVTTFDWAALAAASQFDVVLMDPPWQLATANPSRGVALGYSQLADDDIAALPIPELQRGGGLLFVWVINAKYKFTLDLFDAWGYELVDEIVWVKLTVNRRLFKSHGYYLQHAKEVCLVGRRGPGPPGLAAPADGGGICSDVIISERRGQSQKPEELYEIIEALVPNGRYLEVFARRHNLRSHWVSIGNEVAPGLPESDLAALRAGGDIPGARFGRGAG